MPNRALRIVLAVVCVLATAAGLLAILGSRSFMIRVFLHPPEAEVSTLFLVLAREMGGLLLMLGFMLFFAARDPVRNVAIVDGLIVGLCILAITPLLSLYTSDIRRLYPGYLIWGRAVGRLAVAALIYYLRPRTSATGQSHRSFGSSGR